jgi:hypothetical protein
MGMRTGIFGRRTGGSRFGVAAAVAVFIGSLAGLGVTSTASGTGGWPPNPTGIKASASTDNSDLGGAVPGVLVKAGGRFTLTVTLEPYGAAFDTPTTLGLTASLAEGGPPAGVLSRSFVTMPAGVNSATFSVSYSAVDNGVRISVAVAHDDPYHPVRSGKTAPFDVLKVLSKFASDDPRLADGLGVGNAGCTRRTTESECGTLVLSDGFASRAGALSLGACTPELECTEGSQVVQFIADLGDEYSPEHPALMIFRCSKELCAGKGVTHYTLKVSFEASGPLDLESAPCVSKGVARDSYGNDFCTDYRKSHRDNVGDLLLYFLFTHDMRGST